MKPEITEYPDGIREWCLNGKLHREDGPAVERPDGYRAWYQNGKLHREDGPAIEWHNGDREWYLNGVTYSLNNYMDKLFTEDQMEEKVLFAMRWK